MKTLIYVPVIHASADLGSLAKDVAKRGMADLGEKLWKEHKKTVEGFWDVIAEYFDSVNVTGMKIYQDGMVAEGELGAKIVEEGIKSGSKNYELISRLLGRGAFLVKTEDFNLVRQELRKLVAITQEKSKFKKLLAFIKYKLVKNRLLNQRDKFIARRINETFKHSEKGILFIGASHNIKKRLSKSIYAKEIKDIQKVRQYHKLLPFCDKYKEEFRELARYLVLPIKQGERRFK